MTTAGYNPYQPILEETPQPPPKYGTIAETGATITTTQPRRPNYVYVHTRDEDHHVNSSWALIYSGIVAVLCGICSPITLVCSIPAVVLAVMSSQGDCEQRQKNSRMSGVLATIALITGMVLVVVATVMFIYYRKHNPQSQE